ncbi:MAG: hypothetical protein HY735_03550 [Verrucomicrobia bacterium]|nr:hypothetical protein [Verrucomicrobiota bacterium]
MRMKPILLLAGTFSLLLASGCSKSETSERTPSEIVQPESAKPKPQVDPEVLAMAQKLRATLELAAQGENPNSKP